MCLRLGCRNFKFPGFPLKHIFYYINGPHNQSVRIDTDPIYFFTLDFQEYVFIKVTKKSPGCCASLLAQHPGNFQDFYKDISLEVQSKHVNRIHVYPDGLVMGSIHVIKKRV